VTDLSKLHSDVWTTLTADEKADVLRMQFMAQEVVIRCLLAATGVRLVGGSDDEEGR
jgi:hypothetical protein